MIAHLITKRNDLMEGMMVDDYVKKHPPEISFSLHFFTFIISLPSGIRI